MTDDSNTDNNEEQLKRKRQKIVLGIALVVLLIILAVPVVADNYLTDTFVRDFTASAVVIPSNNSSLSIGVDPGANMNFGRVVAGVDMRKFVDLSTSRPTLATASASGNISDIVTTETNIFFINSTELEIELSSNTTGYYDGKIHIKTQVASGGLGERWLRLKQQLY